VDVKPLILPAAFLSLWIAFTQVEARQPALRPGDNGPATKAAISDPAAVAVDGSKALYIVEGLETKYLESVIRRVDLKTGIITTVRTATKLTPIDTSTSRILGATESGEWMRGPGLSRRWPATGSRTRTACCSERARQGLASNSSSARFSGVSLA
jgi:hypothetical protein